MLANLQLKRLASHLFSAATVLSLTIGASHAAQAQYTEQPIYTFTGGSDGADPHAGLISDSKGNLYGTTNNGGNTAACPGGYAPGCGVVFKLSPPSGGSGPWTETVLYTFNGGTDGGLPNGVLIFDTKGNLYGTTVGFGKDYGVVFELTPPTGGGSGQWTETVLYTFTGRSDGGGPWAGLIFDSKGNLYGTTAGGGDTHGLCLPQGGCGVVFELSPPVKGGTGPWSESVLYTFTDGNDGGVPTAGLIFDSKGNLYGTTQGGGSSVACYGINPRCGVVFELSPPSGGGSGPWIENVLLIFTSGSGGASPWAGLIFDSSGNLYGTASLGGNGGADCPLGCGVVFELSPPSGGGSGPWTETVLTFFYGGSGGELPYGGLVFDPGGHLYGTLDGGDAPTSTCPSQSCGMVFQLGPPSGGGTGYWSSLILYGFSDGADGANPYAGVIIDSQGNLFGTAAYGGDNSACSGLGCGVVFEVSPPALGTVTLSTTSLKFGNQVLDTTSAVLSVTVTNSSSNTLDIFTIDISGNFAISANTCGNSLAAGKNCKVSVTFTPTALGPFTGTLSFYDSAANSPQTVALSGTGVEPATISPTSYTFAAQTIGVTSPAKNFTLTNNQSGTLSNITTSVTGDFAISATTCSTTLGSKKSCTISVTFTPLAPGTLTGTLSVTDNANNSPQTASLTGTGNNPKPTITSLSPNSATAGGAQLTLTVNGTNFVKTSVVNWAGAALTTTYVSSMKITAIIPATDIATAGTFKVTVTNPAPGGGTSASSTFTVNNPLPTLTKISPSSATHGGASFTLTATGTGFVVKSKIQWNGTNLTTTFVSSTSLTATISAADIKNAGTASVTVNNPTPGGGTSASKTFTIN
jgi:hypothetical protein